MPDTRPEHRWSDADLNRALDELLQCSPVRDGGVDRVRTVITQATAIDLTPDNSTGASSSSGARADVLDRQSSFRGRWVRRAGAVGIAAVLVAAALLAPSLLTENGRPVVSADAARALTQAAQAIGASDPAVAPGQYRYLQTHAWWAATEGDSVRLIENLETVWVPADPAAAWMLKRAPTGQVQWVTGDPGEAAAAAVSDPQDIYPTMDVQAVCGNFYGSGGCDRAGSWQDPTPVFLADLPRDPTALLDRLRADAPDNGRGDAELLVYAADLLRTGLVPADLRASLYQALAALPGLDIVDGALNLDGRTGTALGIQNGPTRQDIIIDPATGAFIGEREVALEDTEEIPAGTPISSTSLTTAVVDTLGATP